MRFSLAAVCIVLALGAQAEEIGVSGVSLVPGQPELILIEGMIDRGASAKLGVILELTPTVTTVILHSGGGYVSEGLLIARTIRARGLDTVVLPSLGCASACVFAFAGGVNRAALGAIGVHQIVGGEPSVAGIQRDLAEIVEVFTEAGIASGLIYKMLATPNEEVYYLTPEEIEAFGLNTGHVAWLDSTSLGPQ